MGDTRLRVLFVDDEPRVLDGLRRMLRGRRDEWDMRFAASGDEALAMLEEQEGDIIVSDMRMPGMSGLDLLNAVKERYPQMVRIVLSGQVSNEMVIRAVGPVHQYLHKPCEPDELCATLSRMGELRRLLEIEQIKRVVARIESLPSMPSLYQRLVELLDSPEVSIQEVGQTIAQDLAMTTKVLHLVNSSFFGLHRTVSDPVRAVNYLGLETVKALVLTVHVFTTFGDSIRGFSLNREWEHGMQVGSLAKQIMKAEDAPAAMVDQTFIAGLLHDVGKIVLASELGEEYREIVETVNRDNVTYEEAEFEKIGAAHAEVGAFLLGLWGLPGEVMEAVNYHHRPMESAMGAFGVLTAVHLANFFAWQCDSGRFDVDGVCMPYIEKLGLADRLPVWREACLPDEADRDAA